MKAPPPPSDHHHLHTLPPRMAGNPTPSQCYMAWTDYDLFIATNIHIVPSILFFKIQPTI